MAPNSFNTGPRARLGSLTRISFFNLLSTKVIVLPVSNNALTLTLFGITVLMVWGDGFRVVKQHERTVQKLMKAAGREIEQTSLPLSSFCIGLLRHPLLVLIQVGHLPHLGISVVLRIFVSWDRYRPLRWFLTLMLEMS